MKHANFVIMQLDRACAQVESWAASTTTGLLQTALPLESAPDGVHKRALQRVIQTALGHKQYAWLVQRKMCAYMETTRPHGGPQPAPERLPLTARSGVAVAHAQAQRSRLAAHTWPSEQVPQQLAQAEQRACTRGAGVRRDVLPSLLCCGRACTTAKAK